MTEEGKELPEDVYEKQYYDEEHSYQYYTYLESQELTKDEKMEYILLRQNENMKTIKKCILFFTVLTVVSLIFSIIGVIGFLTVI